MNLIIYGGIGMHFKFMFPNVIQNPSVFTRHEQHNLLIALLNFECKDIFYIQHAIYVTQVIHISLYN